MQSKHHSDITRTEPKSCEEWDDDEIYQARVDFEDWCTQQDSQDLELYIQQRKFSQEIANRIREQVALEEHLFSDRPDQLLVDSFNEFELQGTKIGDYRLLRQLGQGGMGTVWLAQQEERVKRHVAVKLIKPGFDSQEFVRRFSVERQALAVMSHHNIARVLDAGLTAKGRPYFVMEYISGTSIVKYCEQHELSVEARLKLFLQLCSAIQHAHQKGVIHRDIKPSNVLIADVDGTPTVKVIDFGLAKALDANLDEELISITQDRMMIGSPLWMSPEQIGGPFGLSQKSADTRSDVYSLGVVLYQLLTGTTPIRHETYLTLSFEELAKRVQEEVPPPPSVRLKRQMDSEVVTKSYAPEGDLDWIVLKALEKEPDRRYEGVASLAKDIQCYLDHEPVQARRPSRGYQLRMFLAKHRVVASFVAALITLLIVGTATSTALAIWAIKERAVARKQANDILALQEESGRIIEDFQTDIEFMQQSIGNPLEGFFIPVAGRPIYDVSTIIEKLNRSDFSDAPRVEAIFRQNVGRFTFRAADYDNSQIQFERARDLFFEIYGDEHPKTINCLIYLAKIADAKKEFDKEIEHYEDLVSLKKSTKGPFHSETLSMSMRLANAHFKNGNHEKAIQLGEKTFELFEKHHQNKHRLWIRAQCSLAVLYLKVNDFENASRVAEDLLDFLNQNRLAHIADTELECCYCIVAVFEATNRHETSIELVRRAINLADTHFKSNHSLTVDLKTHLARLLLKNGQSKQAAQVLREAVDIAERHLGQGNPQTILAKSELERVDINVVVASDNTSVSQTVVTDLEGAQVSKAIEFFEQLLAKTQGQLGQLYIRSERAPEATELLEESTGYYQRKHGNSAETLRALRPLVTAYHNSGQNLKAIELGKEIIKLHRDGKFQTDKAHATFLIELSEYLFEADERDEAIQLGQDALDFYRSNLKPDHLPTQEALYHLRSLFLRANQEERALELQKSYSDQFVKEFGASFPASIFEQKNYAVALQLAGRFEEAKSQFKKVMKLCEVQYGSSNYNSMIYLGYFQNHLMANAEYEQAKPVILNWLELLPTDSPHYYNRKAWILVSLADYHAKVDEFSEAKSVITAIQELDQSVPAHTLRPPRREMNRMKSILGLCLAQEGRFAEAKELAVKAYQSLQKEPSCTNWPYFRWYLLDCVDRLIEIHELANEPAAVEKWKRERVEMEKHLADTLHSIKID